MADIQCLLRCKHKKGACKRCDSGICSACCKCVKPKGRPKKVLRDIEPTKVNATRIARPSLEFLNLEDKIPDYEFVEPVTVVEQPVPVPSDAASISPRAGTIGNTLSAGTDMGNEISSQANIVRMLTLLGISEKSVFSDVRRFPSIDDRRKAKYRNDLNTAAFQSIQRVFRAMTAGVLNMLLPAWHVPEMKKWGRMIKIPCVAGSEDSDDSDEDGSEQTVTRSIALSIANCGTTTSLNARILMAQMSGLTSDYVEKMLFDCGRKLSKATLRRAMFQAKVDAEYLHHGLHLIPFFVTHQRMAEEVIKLAVDTVYSSKHVSRLAWLSKKKPFQSNKWKHLEHVDSMKSLVLKHDVQEIFKEYVVEHNTRWPDVPHMKESLFYEITRNITGGGKKQCARSGVDYIKVNFHTDNFELIDKIIDVVAPASSINQTSRSELLLQRSAVFTFLSYTYAQHVFEGVMCQYEGNTDCTHYEHETSDEEKEVYQLYETISRLAENTNGFEDCQSQLVQCVKTQMDVCARIRGKVCSTEKMTVSSHSPQYTLDLVHDRAPRTESLGVCGQLQCESCRCPFLFYDNLRRAALSKFIDASELVTLSDSLLTIHQCERRTFRYMAHVVQDVQQQYFMKQARCKMSANTAYVVFDFKQKFWSRGFREGGDSYYGKKGMQWFGMGVFVKTANMNQTCHEEGESSYEDGVRSDNESVPHEDEGVPHEDDVSHEDEGVPNEDEGVPHEDEGVPHEDDVSHEDEGVPNEDVGVLHEDLGVFHENGSITYEDDGVTHEDGVTSEDDDSEGSICFEYEDCVFHEDDSVYMKGNEDNDDSQTDEEDNNEGICLNMVQDASMDEIESVVEENNISEDDEKEADSTCNDNVSGSEENARMDDNDESDGSQTNENDYENDDSMFEENNADGTGAILHFFDIIVQDDDKSDSFAVLSCLEAGLNALHLKFPAIHNVILQSDNAKNFASKDMKLLVHQVVTAASMNLFAYYHNEAATGKDICDTHFAHMQARVTAYISEGEGGRKVSTARQLAVALSSKCVKDTTVLLVKPKHDAPFVSTKVPAIQGISNFYAVEYDEKNQKAKFFRNLGQVVPSITKTLAMAPLSSTSENSFGYCGTNFTGCKVVLHNLGTEKVITRVRSRYRHRSRTISKRQIDKEEQEHKNNMALKEICYTYPRCEQCLYHFANNYKLENHRCSGGQVKKDAITLAMVYANSLLATRDFSVSGQATAVISSTIVLGKPTYSSFEGNFFPGWAHSRKNQNPQLSNRVEEFIAQCWREGEASIVDGRKIKSRMKVSAEAVQCRLTAQYAEGLIRLSEVPIVAQVRAVYQNIGQNKNQLHKKRVRKGASDDSGRNKRQKTARSFIDIPWQTENLNHLKVPVLKMYLKEHKLKISGNKADLIERIHEHMDSIAEV